MPENEARCPQCSAQLPSGAVRCVQCGAEVSSNPPEKGIESWFSGEESPPWVEPARALEQPPPLPLEATEPPPLPVEPVAKAVEEPPPPTASPDEPVILGEATEARPDVPEVPVVRPAARRARRLDDLPPAQPLPSYRRSPEPEFRPRPTAESIEPPPRPRIFLAMFVLLAMLVAFACGLSVIVYAIYAGLKASQPRRAEAVLVVPGKN